MKKTARKGRNLHGLSGHRDSRIEWLPCIMSRFSSQGVRKDVVRMLPIALLSVVSGCGGGGGSSTQGAETPEASEPPRPPAQVPSLGGIWRSEEEGRTSFFYITERGDLTVDAVLVSGESRWHMSGGGMVAVTGEGRVVGNFAARGNQEKPPGVYGLRWAVSCRLEGSLQQRVSLALELECTPESGDEWTAEITLQYDHDLYEYPSSLSTIAGNFELNTLQGRPHLNSLNVNGDGVVFGAYRPDFGPNCTVNGTVSVVDPRFNLYWTEWRFSNCRGAAHNGAELSGTLYTLPPGFLGYSGSLIIHMSGMVGGLFQTFSIHYVRV